MRPTMTARAGMRPLRSTTSRRSDQPTTKETTTKTTAAAMRTTRARRRNSGSFPRLLLLAAASSSVLTTIPAGVAAAEESSTAQHSQRLRANIFARNALGGASASVADDAVEDDSTVVNADPHRRRMHAPKEYVPKQPRLYHRDSAAAAGVAISTASDIADAAAAQSSSPEKRIVGGEEVSDASAYPYFAALVGCEWDDRNDEWDCCGGNDDVDGYCWGGCGGALISSRHVLTAAHCLDYDTLKDEFDLKGVRIGAYCREGDDDDCEDAGEFVEADWESVEVHEYFSRDGDDGDGYMPVNDVAIITLKTPVPNIDPVYVDTGSVLSDLGTYADLTALGHGRTRYHSFFRYLASTLREAHFYNLPERICEDEYDDNYVEGDPTGPMMCAGQYDDDQDATSTCRGDSGGPLLSTDTSANNAAADVDGHVLVGVSSWGKKKCEGGVDSPSVFARAGDMVQWFGPKVCNTFEFRNERPEWCDVCEDDYAGNSPGWCDDVDPSEEGTSSTTTTTEESAGTATTESFAATTQEAGTATTTPSSRVSPTTTTTTTEDEDEDEVVVTGGSCEAERSQRFRDKKNQDTTCGALQSSGKAAKLCGRDIVARVACPMTCAGRC